MYPGGRAEGDEIPSRLRTKRGAGCLVVQSNHPEIMTAAKTKSQTPNELSHPGAPGLQLCTQI